MADEKLTALVTLSGADGADLLYIVDVDDTTDDPSGSSKAITVDNLLPIKIDSNDNLFGGPGGTGGSLGVNADDNVLLGNNVAPSSTTSDFNVFIGGNIAQSAATFSLSYSVVLGWGAGQDLAISAAALDNTLIGGFAATNLNNGSRNAVVGRSSMTSLVNGSDNSALGYQALFRLNSNSSGNVGLGANVGPTSPTTINNELWINNAASDTPLVRGYFANHPAGPKLQFNGTLELGRALGEKKHNLAAGTDIDVKNGTWQETASLTGVTRTFTFNTTGLITNYVYGVNVLLDDAGGATALTWTGVSWSNGNTEPTWSNGRDVAGFILTHNGASWDILGSDGPVNF